MNKIKILIIMAGLFSWLTGCNGQPDKGEYKDDKFRAGQIWNYNTRVGEENSKIEILKVEKYDSAGIVVHIFVNGLKVKILTSRQVFQMNRTLTFIKGCNFE